MTLQIYRIACKSAERMHVRRKERERQAFPRTSSIRSNIMGKIGRVMAQLPLASRLAQLSQELEDV